MSLVQNVSSPLLVYDFIVLLREYKVERDVVVTLVGVLALASVIFNALLLTVIIKDPFKQLRNITATLLAFNTTANFCMSVVLLIDSVFFWIQKQIFTGIIMYLNSVCVSLYFIGNLLHTFNIYGSVVFPIRYASTASQAHGVLVRCLTILFAITACAIIIPPYTLPKDRVPYYSKSLLAFMCIQFAVLTVIFVYLYVKIFQTLKLRTQILSTSFHIERSTRQGMKIMKRNLEVAKTLFIHVLFFMVATVPEIVIIMLNLYCSSHGYNAKLNLALLFAIPCVYITFVFHPILWLCRLKSYKQALTYTLSFSRRSQLKTFNDNVYPKMENTTSATKDL